MVARGLGGVLDIVEDGRHGVLYDGDDAEALAAAIDNARQIRFNELDLRQRAERFSAKHFDRGIRSLLAAQRSTWKRLAP